jgi:hypothetical protein
VGLELERRKIIIERLARLQLPIKRVALCDQRIRALVFGDGRRKTNRYSDKTENADETRPDSFGFN